jgi:hypothetical protein
MYVYDQAFRRQILDIQLNQIGGLYQISSIIIYITQLLPTEYSINITNGFSR